nr:putative transcription factor lepb [Quercus suber]
MSKHVGARCTTRPQVTRDDRASPAHLNTWDDLDKHFTWDAEHLFVPRQIAVPPREVGLAYEEWYKRNIDALIPILHMPSVQSLSETVYNKLYLGDSGDVGSVALMLAIYASADLWGVRRAAKSRTSDRETEMSAILAKHALCAAEHARLSSPITIENLQATILLMFYLSHLEGWTSRARILHSNSVTMARDLGLHKIDALNSRTATTTQAQIIEAEIGRRIWWHITFEKPRNLNPEDLSLHGNTFSRPDDEPTAMTYHLQRMKVALVCREVIDTLGPSYLTGDFPPTTYEKVDVLDAKFCDVLAELPEFLQVDNLKRIPATRSEEIVKDQFALPTAVLNFLIRTRRCKLHLPFLIRARSDPRYMHSRYMCLDSARTVIRIQQMYSEEVTGSLTQSPCLGSILQHMFFAAIVLVMDTCVNNPHDTTQIAEVRHAIKLIEQVKGESRYAEKFLDSLKVMLQKHRIPIEPATHPKEDVHGQKVSAASERANPTRPSAQEAGPDLADTTIREQNMNGDTTFDNAWQDFLGAGTPLLDLQTWDSLMNDLEMHIV